MGYPYPGVAPSPDYFSGLDPLLICSRSAGNNQRIIMQIMVHNQCMLLHNLHRIDPFSAGKYNPVNNHDQIRRNNRF
jgi:hypothetical protein